MNAAFNIHLHTTLLIGLPEIPTVREYVVCQGGGIKAGFDIAQQTSVRD